MKVRIKDMNIIGRALTYIWVLGFSIAMSCSSNSPVDSSSGDVLVKSITIIGSNIEDGNIKQLSVTVLPNNAKDRTVSWSVSDKTVATISNSGLLSAVANGSVKIMATANDGSGVSAERTFSISGVSGPQIKVESITINGSDITDGQPKQLSLTVLPENANNKTVSWTVSNQAIADINADGLITPKLNGTITVTATSNDGSGTVGTIEINISGVTVVYATTVRAESILLWQRNNGGWGKAVPDMSQYSREQTDAEKATALSQKNYTDTTIDNGHVTTELRDLLSAYKSTNNPNYLAAAEKALDYLFEAQYDNGGWPQYYPDKSYYRHQITYNDNAMVNVMNVMWDISKGKSPLDVVNPIYKDKAVAAFNKGIDIILKTQISYNGKKAVWCAQHDEVTLEPALARSYELPSFSGSESVGVVKTLMLVENPSTEIIDAINGAIDWFNTSKIVGYKLIDVVDGQPDPSSVYENGKDKILVESPGNVMWARFYDLDTNLPFFCSRDGIKKNTIAEISYERRNGYSWYGGWPSNLIGSEYTAWKTKNGI